MDQWLLDTSGTIIFCMEVVVVVGIFFLFVMAPGWTLERIQVRLRAGARSDNYRLQRQQGTLNQQLSLPFLVRDGGRGPAGGRLLLARQFAGSATLAQAVAAWLLAALCLVNLFWMAVTSTSKFSGLATIAFACLLLLAAMASRRWAQSLDHDIEVEACPPAMGDLLRIHAGNCIGKQQEPVVVRLRLEEQIRSRIGGVPAWSREVLWEEPVACSEVALQPPYRSQFIIRIPEHLPGTYLAPGYRLEWIVEIRDGQSFMDYPLPVVK